MRDVFVDAVAAVRPDLPVGQPWRRTEDPGGLRAVFADAGIDQVDVETARDELELPTADDWWRIVRGTGLRATLTQLAPSEADNVRARCNAYIAEEDVRAVVFGTHIASTVAP
jgi:hypothetical protein